MIIVETFGGNKLFLYCDDLKKCNREIPTKDITMEHFYKRCRTAYSNTMSLKLCMFIDIASNSKILSPIEKEEPRKVGRYFIR